MTATTSSNGPQASIRPPNAPILKSLGERIRYMRSVLAISQNELARRVKISQAIISDLESGKAQTSGHTPSIAHALGVNAYWLETGRDHMPQFGSYPMGDDVIIPVIVAPGNCGGLR